MRRRTIFRTGVVVGSISLSGCAAVLDTEDPGTVLGKIQVLNASLTATRIQLTVRRDSEELHERTVSLSAP